MSSTYSALAGLRVLAVTNMYPTATHPSTGVFVEQQVQSLRRRLQEVTVHFVDRAGRGRRVYRQVGASVLDEAQEYDLVHLMYGGVLAGAVTRALANGRYGGAVVVSFCGSDLFGAPRAGGLTSVSAALGVRESRRAATRADGIVVKSRALAEALPSRIDRARVAILPNGVDLHEFRPLDRQECRRRLGWSASGLHVLFSTNGTDPTKRRDLAEATIGAVRRRGLDASLHVMSGVRHAEVAQWINASDVVLLTSEHEGSPNVVKEALACDVPVVSVDVGDVSERLAGIDGCFLARRDPEDIAEKLLRVAARHSRVAGRRSVGALSLDSVALRLISVYAEALRRRDVRVAAR